MAKDAMPSAVKPYIPADAKLPEMTFRALFMGVILRMVFGASSLYLVLKVGLTVSASIPVAVIAITLFGLAKKVGGKDSSTISRPPRAARSACQASSCWREKRWPSGLLG